MKYKHKQTGAVIEVIDAYSDLLIYKDGDQAKQTHTCWYEPVSPLPPNSSVVSASPPPVVTPVDGSGVTESFHLNDATSTEIAKAINGLGKTYAKKVFDNKPVGGYRDWDDVAKVNRDLPVTWITIAEMNQHVVFDVP